MHTTEQLSFSKRGNLCKNPTAKTLFQIMVEKESNLAVNADVTGKKELLQFADLVGPEICVLKTHIDILEDFDQDCITELKELAEKHNFLIFEDRKFTDIGIISQKQYEHGVHHIVEWADITNAMAISGPGIVQGLKEIGLPLGRGLLLVAELSSSGSLATGSYTEATIKMAEQHPEFVIGFICQKKLVNDPSFIHFTPGVKLAEGGDTLGQQYNTPQKVITERGTDVIIVGRGITQAKDPLAEAKRYREEAWKAIQMRVS